MHGQTFHPILNSLAITALLSLFLPACTHVRPESHPSTHTPGTITIKTLVRGDHHSQYGLFIPHDYRPNASTTYPVIIFLHGYSPPRDNADPPLSIGLAPIVRSQSTSFPFIVIFPQTDAAWFPDAEPTLDVIAELDEVSRHFRVDPDRVSLMGAGLGGYDAWRIGAQYPDRFAALVPIYSAGADLEHAARLVNLPIRAYMSESQDLHFVTYDSDMVQKVSSLGGNAQYIKAPTSDIAGCMDYVFSNGDLVKWLQQQRRQHKNASAVGTQ